MNPAVSSFQHNLADSIAKIRQKLSGSRYAFVSSEAERGLGLEELLPELTIMSIQNDSVAASLSKQGKLIHLSDITTTGKLAQSQVFREWLAADQGSGFASARSDSKTYLQFFKNTADGVLEELGASPNCQILNNTASLTRGLENKVAQYQWLEKTSLSAHLPQSQITTLGQLPGQIEQGINGGVVVQLPFGHTGSSTYIIPSGDTTSSYPELAEQIKQYPNRACRLVQMIHGHAFTINGCIYDGKVLVAGLSYQYTGLAGLTNNPATTVGNDWMLPESLLSEQQIAQIRLVTELVGKSLIVEGFRGFFGVDLVIDNTTGKPFLIEVNPRQIASVPMHTKLQLEAEQIPLALYNLAEFLGVRDLEVDAAQYNSQGLKSLPGAQIFLRSPHKNDYSLPATSLKSGVYRQQSDNAARELEAASREDEVIYLDSDQDRPLIWQKDGISLTDFDASGFLLLLRPSGYILQQNDEVARIQARFPLSLVDGSIIKLKPLARDTMRKIAAILLK